MYLRAAYESDWSPVAFAKELKKVADANAANNDDDDNVVLEPEPEPEVAPISSSLRSYSICIVLFSQIYVYSFR